MFYMMLFILMLLVKEYVLKNISIWIIFFIFFNELWILFLLRNCYYCIVVVLGEIFVKIIIYYLFILLLYFCMVM